MLDFRDQGLGDIKQLCQADLTWELIPLYDCSVKEGKACLVLICSQLAILMFSSSSTSLQIPISSEPCPVDELAYDVICHLLRELSDDTVSKFTSLERARD